MQISQVLAPMTKDIFSPEERATQLEKAFATASQKRIIAINTDAAATDTGQSSAVSTQFTLLLIEKFILLKLCKLAICLFCYCVQFSTSVVIK